MSPPAKLGFHLFVAWIMPGISLQVLVLCACCLVSSACAQTKSGPRGDRVQSGLASYYASELHGRRTASGDIYDENKLTAAHRTLPFGTRVRVTNEKNGRSVVVTINDRGPFRKGRIIDVSRRAARELGFIRDGVVRVRVVRLSP